MATIRIANSILTAYLANGVDELSGADIRPATGTEEPNLAVIETGDIGLFPNHAIHPDAGIITRDRGTIALQSAVRADELNAPAIWLRSSSRTTELVARSTAGPYFGFRPRAWLKDDLAGADAVVTDEAAALVPLETGFREDLTRAWFIITGLPLVTHVLAVPQDFDPAQVEATVEWLESAGGLDRDEREVVHARLTDETAVPLQTLTELLTGLRWTMTTDDRRSVAELFARAGVASKIGPVHWYRYENEPKS